MKRSLKLLMSALTALVLPAFGWAATPTATWTDFNTLTSGDFTLTKADACTVNEDGSLTLGGAGLSLPLSGSEASVVLEVSNAPTTEAILIDVLMNNSHVSLHSDGSNLRQKWNDSSVFGGPVTWNPAARQIITLTVKKANPGGTTTYINGVQVMHNDGLMTTSGALQTLRIGAYDANATKPATGMIVHSLKVYASKLSTFEAEQQGFIDSMAWRASFNGANTTEGWITGWGGEDGDSYADTITGQGYQIKTGCHPWVNYTVNKPFSIALYANVSEIANTDGKKASLIALGNSDSNFVLAKTAANQIAVCIGNVIVGDLHIEDADIAVKGSYHLIVFGTDGTTSFLQVDDKKVSGTHDSAPTWNGGLQIGAMFQGIGDYVQGYNMIVDEVRGYSEALDDAALAKLTAKYSEYTPLYVDVEGTTTYSELALTTTGATPLVITLKPGAVLTLDEAPTLRELNIISEGTAESPATVLASVENPFANAESAKITGGETKIPAAMYFSNIVNLSALNSVTLFDADDATTDAPQEITNVINVANGKTVKLEGYFTLSGSNQVQSGGTLVINSGKTTLSTANQGIKGTLTVAKDATLTSATTDGLAYDTAGVVVNVYGTLDLGATRWTIFANNNTLKLYAGATVIGAGQETNGALDVWENTTDSVAINVLKNGDDAADVTISAELRCRSGKTVFNIEEGMTAVIDNENDPGKNGGGIKVTGAGTLKITSANTYSGGTIVDADATLVVANTAALGSGAVSGTGKIVVDTITLDATGYTEFSGSYGVQNNGTLIVAAGKEGTIDVPAGSTVKLVLNDALFAAGYTASGVTGAGTIAFYKDGNLDTVVQSGNTYGGSGSVWTPTATDSAWESCWNVTEVPTSGEIAINTANLEADISVTVPNNFSKITVNAHPEYTTAITFADGVTATTLAVAGKVKLPIAVINGVDIAVEDDSILIADVAEDATLTKALSGSYAFWKAGTGTLTLNANVAVNDGVEILAGTLKFGQVNTTKYTIGGTGYGTQGNVKVYGGAVLDVNGVPDAFLNMVTLCEDAVFANDSTTAVGNNSRQLKGLTLEGNATVRATNNFGILASGHNDSTLTLGGKTLTKEGDGEFWLSNTDVSDGTLKVEAGKFTAIGTGDEAASFANVTFDTSLETEAFNLGTGNISGTVTKKGTGSLTLNGTISGSEALTVEAGTLVLTAANTRTGNVTIASGATLDVSGETAMVISSSSHNTSAVVTVNGTLKTREWNWREGTASAFGTLAHAVGQFVINGGTVEFMGDCNGDRIFTIGENGAIFKTAEGVTYTNSGNLTDSNPMTIAAGSVVLSGGNGGYSGNITIAKGASLATSGDATVPFGKGSIENNGTLTVGGTNGQLPAVSGTGDVNITAQTRIAGDITTTGTLTIGASVTMTYYPGDFTDTDLSINGPSILLNGSIETTNAGSSITVASGETISGTGTVTGALTLNAGATVDATAGALTVSGDITLGETLNVKLTNAPTAEAVVPVLAKTGLTAGDVANVALSVTVGDAAADTESYKLVTTDAGYAVAVIPVANVCTGNSGTSYTSVAEAIKAGETTITLVADTAETVTLPAGVTLVAGEYAVTVQDEYGATLEDDGSGNYTGPTYVAKASGMGLAETGYTTLQGAVDAALGLMGTVTLLADLEINAPITINNNDAWFTIDLGGKTLTATGSSAIYVKDGNVTIKNGKIDATGVGIWICDKAMSADVAPFDFSTNPYGNASVTLDSTLTVTSTGDNCILVYNGAKVSSAATLKTTSDMWAAIQGTGLVGNPTRIEIVGGSVEAVNHAIYHPQDGILTIGTAQDKVTITGATGVEMRAGTLNVVNADITATGEYTGPVANGDGSTVDGAAIALSQHTTNLPITATIESATLTADNGKTFVVADTTNAEEVVIGATIASGIITDTSKVDITIPTMELKAGAEGYTLKTVVAAIGETKYETLQEAVDATTADANTITLLGDMELTAWVDLDADDEVVLNLNGKTITENVTDDPDYGAIYVRKGAKLTITGEGTIATDGGIVIGNYGTVTVENGTIAAGDDAGADVSIYNFYNGADYYGTTEVTGGTVTRIWNCGIIDITAGTVAHLDNSGAAEISGGTVTEITLRDGSDAPEVTDAGTLTAGAGLEGTISVEEGYEVVYDDGKYTVKAIQTSIWDKVITDKVDDVTDKAAVETALAAIATALKAADNTITDDATAVTDYIARAYGTGGTVSATDLINGKDNIAVSVAYDLPLMEELPQVTVAATAGDALTFTFALEDITIAGTAEKAKTLVKYSDNLTDGYVAYGEEGAAVEVSIVGGALKVTFTGTAAQGFIKIDGSVE